MVDNGGMTSEVEAPLVAIHPSVAQCIPLQIVVKKRLTIAHVAIDELPRFRRDVRELDAETGRRDVRGHRLTRFTRPSNHPDRIELIAAG